VIHRWLPQTRQNVGCLETLLKAQGEPAEAIAAFCEALDHTQPGSDLALLIERALAESDH
jgi:hypothetical protein